MRSMAGTLPDGIRNLEDWEEYVEHRERGQARGLLFERSEVRAMRYILICIMYGLITLYPFTHVTPSAQAQSPIPKPPDTVYLLKPAHIFDGESAQLHDG